MEGKNFGSQVTPDSDTPPEEKDTEPKNDPK